MATLLHHVCASFGECHASDMRLEKRSLGRPLVWTEWSLVCRTDDQLGMVACVGWRGSGLSIWRDTGRCDERIL